MKEVVVRKVKKTDWLSRPHSLLCRPSWKKLLDSYDLQSDDLRMNDPVNHLALATFHRTRPIKFEKIPRSSLFLSSFFFLLLLQLFVSITTRRKEAKKKIIMIS